MYYPNGYIVKTEDPMDSFIIYGEMNKRGSLAKGFSVEVPNLNNAGNGLKNVLFKRLYTYLHQVKTGQRIQFRYTRDCDFGDILDVYERETEGLDERNVWGRRVREKIAGRCRRLIREKKLRREYLTIYVGVSAGNFIRGDFVPEDERSRKRFEKEVAAYFKSALTSLSKYLMLPICPLDHVELSRDFRRAVNKSEMDIPVDYSGTFSPDLRDLINSNARKPTISDDNCASFHSDGYFHNILSLRTFPAMDTEAFFGNILLEHDVQNMTIAVNMDPLIVEDVIVKDQTHYHRLRKDLEEEPDEIAMEAGMDELREKVYNMRKRASRPFKINFSVHLWSKNLSDLQSDTATVLNQIGKMQASVFHCNDLVVQAMNSFFKTLPGYLYGGVWDFEMEADQKQLATIIPFNSSFVGKGAQGNVLFEGDHGNIMTFSFFDDGTPQHLTCMGQNGAGKSINFFSIISQVFHRFKKIVILEEGSSYFSLSQIYGDDALHVRLDQNIRETINYFDTVGGILTASQIDFVTGFLVNMCGESDNQDLMQDRNAIISPYVNAIYSDAFSEWQKKPGNRGRLEKAASHAMTVEFMIPHMPASSKSEDDAFYELRDILAKSGEELEDFDRKVLDFYNSITLQSRNDYIFENSLTLRNIAFCMMTRDEMPYHSQIVEMMRLTPMPYHQNGKAREKLGDIANRLGSFSVLNGKGQFFDGSTTLDFNRRLIHVDIAENASENFKRLAGPLVNNIVRNVMLSMKRSAEKLYLFEEVGRFVSIKGAAEILKQSYAQFRKFNCCAITVGQSTVQIQAENVASIVMTQSKHFIFLKNTDPDELLDMTKHVSLSEETRKKITEFTSPEHIQGEEKYSSFMYYAQREGWPIVGVGRNYASKEILVAAATKGDLHSKVRRLLKDVGSRNPDMPFVKKLFVVMELLREDTRLYELLGKIEKFAEKLGVAGDDLAALVLEAKIEARNMVA